MRRTALVLALAITLAALIQGHHRASKGRNALLKWAPTFEALERGEPIYEVGDEGYPTLPLSLLILRPFHAAGPLAGPLAWSLLSAGLAWWIVACAMGLAAGRPGAFPPWGQVLVILLCFRALYSDLQHGNINVLVGASVAAAAWQWRRGRDWSAGLWIAFGAVLKVTPILALLYFAWKRSARALGGAVLGLGLFAFVVPALSLGWTRTANLDAGWWRQMVRPYLARGVEGAELEMVQTVQINQSLLGVMARHLTASPAIEADAETGREAVFVNWLDLGPEAFRRAHLAAAIACLVWLILCLRPAREDREPVDGARPGLTVLGEFSLLALAMLFLSERSWKHHYVLLAFPLAYLVWHALEAPRGDRRRHVAAAGLGASVLLHGLSGEAVLGARGSDLAEAYGAFLTGGIALFVAVGLVLRAGAGRIAAERSDPRGCPSGAANPMLWGLAHTARQRRRPE